MKLIVLNNFNNLKIFILQIIEYTQAAATGVFYLLVFKQLKHVSSTDNSVFKGLRPGFNIKEMKRRPALNMKEWCSSRAHKGLKYMLGFDQP